MASGRSLLDVREVHFRTWGSECNSSPAKFSVHHSSFVVFWEEVRAIGRTGASTGMWNAL